jgi:transcriptional regulator with XRE-family HTH domain
MNKKKIKKTIHAKEYHIVIAMLRELREHKQLTQTGLADKIGSDQTFISKIEIGERRLDIIELKYICEALDIDLVEFIKLVELKIKSKVK